MVAKLRVIQQSWWFHLLAVPVLITAGTALYNCAGSDFSNFGVGCLKMAAGAGASGFLFYAIGIIQHSPGSASFKADGTPNAAVANVVTIQKKVDAEPDNQAAIAAVQRVSTIASIEAMRAANK